MVRNRDPPASNATRRKSICDYSGDSLFDSSTELKVGKHYHDYDKYASMEEDISNVEEVISWDLVETELLDPKLLEEARQCMLLHQAKETVERQFKQGPPGMSFGEEAPKAQKVVDVSTGHNCTEVANNESRDFDDQENFGKYDQPEMFPLMAESTSAENADTKAVEQVAIAVEQVANAVEQVANEEGTELGPMVLHDAVGEDADATLHKGETLPGFWIHFFEYLTCALTNICSRPHGQQDIAGILAYEMPVRSVQDADDIGVWGRSDAEQDSLKPGRFARAIDFSSKRIDGENTCIALYDEVKLKQEVHMVEIPEEYLYDYDEAGDGECENLSYLASRGVPEAVVVQSKKTDDVSLLEENSVTDSQSTTRDSRSTTRIRAWSLSPRRKRMLEEKAKAIISDISQLTPGR